MNKEKIFNYLFKKNIKRLASVFMMALLVFSLACQKGGAEENANDGSSNQTSESSTSGVPSPADISNYEGPGAPDVYAFALRIKVRSEFIIYINDDQSVASFYACNEEAKQIANHTNIQDFSLYDCVIDIFYVSIDDFAIDTDKEDMSITLIESNRSEPEADGMLQVAEDAAKRALLDRNKTGKINVIVPEGFVYNEIKAPEGEEEENLRFEDNPYFDESIGELVCSSQKELDEAIEFARKVDPHRFGYDIKITKDITLDISNNKYDDFTFDLDGNNIALSGYFAYTSDEVHSLRIKNASSVDLSNITIDWESAKNIKPDYNLREGETEEQAYWNPQRRNIDIVHIENTNANNIIPPEEAERVGDGIIDEKSNATSFSIFEPYLLLGGDNNQSALAIMGPLEDYDVRKEKEEAVLTSIFENGEYRNLTGQTSNNFYYICTDVTMDIGECTLPNMDYEEICVGKGGKVTLTGKLYITGGTFRMSTSEPDGIDIRGLTIVKKHPSPDMIWVSYDPAVGINEDLCKCKTASGTIYYTNGSGRISITVW